MRDAEEGTLRAVDDAVREYGADFSENEAQRDMVGEKSLSIINLLYTVRLRIIVVGIS